MNVGNMKFDIEKNKEYAPEELAKLVMKEAYGELFAGTLLRNQTDWAFLDYPCVAKVVNGQVYLHLTPKLRKDTPEMDEFISENPVFSVEKDVLGIHLQENKDKIGITIVRDGDEMYFKPYLKDYVGESTTQGVLALFFNDRGIKTSEDLQKAVECAAKNFQDSMGDTLNPFILPGLVGKEENK